MHPKLRQAHHKRWPVRKVSAIIIALVVSTILVMLVVIEWNLLQASTVKNNNNNKNNINKSATDDRQLVRLPQTAAKQPEQRAASTVVSGSHTVPPTPKPTSPPKTTKAKETQQNIEDSPSRTKTPLQKDKNIIHDDLCGGCRSLKMDHLLRGLHQERCGILIDRVAQQYQSSLSNRQAATLVDQNYTDCRSCLDCPPTHQQYWRYDDRRVRPAALQAQTYYLTSIPSDQHRISTTVLQTPGQNMTQYFASLNAKGEAPKSYLFEYNPSIVALPKSIVFPRHIQQEKPVYVASFRVATTQGCFAVDTMLQMIGGAWISDRIPPKKDYLGLALLREDLSIIEEAVVDLPRPFRKREDFRLFVLHNQLFVSTYCKLTPLWIFHKDDESKYNETHFNGQAVVNWRARDVFPSSLRVRIGADVTQCAKELNDNKHAKNLNFFINKKGETMVELFPLGPHVVRPLHHVLNAAAPVPGREDDISSEELPSPSFFTVEEPLLAKEYGFFEAPFTADRGGACCIEIADPRQPSKMLWLGVSHTKTPHARKKLKDKLRSNQYLSRWYAFEQDDPYNIVAVSGYFCLSSLPGDSATNDEVMKTNPLMAFAAATTPWTLGSIVMDCPVIHFVTGMTEKVNDASKLILGYGVGDCVAMFIEVAKADVIQVLFEGPMQ